MISVLLSRIDDEEELEQEQDEERKKRKKINRSRNPLKRILVCAPSNAACDEIVRRLCTEGIMGLGIPVDEVISVDARGGHARGGTDTDTGTDRDTDIRFPECQSQLQLQSQLKNHHSQSSHSVSQSQVSQASEIKGCSLPGGGGAVMIDLTGEDEDEIWTKWENSQVRTYAIYAYTAYTHTYSY